MSQELGGGSALFVADEAAQVVVCFLDLHQFGDAEGKVSAATSSTRPAHMTSSTYIQVGISFTASG